MAVYISSLFELLSESW